MSWDIALNNRHTLRGGIVTGDDEILQRLWIRLNRELGEWFLNTEVGLPWYQGGYGMLGAKPSRKNEIDLLIRQEIANTEGVLQILKYKTLYATGTRLYDAYCSILLQSRRTIDISFGVTMQSGGSGMPVIPASFIRFESGKTLQDLYDSGELQGPQGKEGDPGLDGMAATIVVGSTVNLPAGSNAYVTNVGDETTAILDFGIPYGAKGEDGRQPTVSVGETFTADPGIPASVINSGTDVDAILNFTIPKGAAATVTVGTTTTGDPGTDAEVTNSGTASDAVLDFVVPRGENGAGSNIAIEGGTTIAVATTDQPDGGKLFTLGVVDDAHNHTIENIAGLQEALDAKISAANLTLTGAVRGVATTAGGATTIDTKWRSCSGVNWTATATRYWFKVAEYTTTGTSRPNLVLMVSSVSIANNYVLGIIRARAYLTPSSAQNVGLGWLSVAGDTFDPNNFVLAHNRTGGTNKLELWMRLPAPTAFTGYYAQVLQDYDGETDTNNLWTMFDQRAPGGAGTIGATMTQYPSFLGSLYNNAATADTLSTARNIVLTGDVTGTASFNGSANATITTKTDGGLIK